MLTVIAQKLPIRLNKMYNIFLTMKEGPRLESLRGSPRSVLKFVGGVDSESIATGSAKTALYFHRRYRNLLVVRQSR